MGSNIRKSVSSAELLDQNPSEYLVTNFENHEPPSPVSGPLHMKCVALLNLFKNHCIYMLDVTLRSSGSGTGSTQPREYN
jgi:hypothetical protein